MGIAKFGPDEISLNNNLSTIPIDQVKEFKLTGNFQKLESSPPIDAFYIWAPILIGLGLISGD